MIVRIEKTQLLEHELFQLEVRHPLFQACQVWWIDCENGLKADLLQRLAHLLHRLPAEKKFFSPVHLYWEEGNEVPPPS